MSIENLVSLIPPPEKPSGNKGNWTTAERQFKTIFPSDFKELTQRYGTGEIASILIANPLKKWGRQYIEQMLSDLHELKDWCDKLVVHRDTPGLLPWGRDVHGHVYCWWTEGDPNDWGIVQIHHNYENEIDVVRGPIADFFVRYLSNKHRKMLGGRRFRPADRVFVPGVPWHDR